MAKVKKASEGSTSESPSKAKRRLFFGERKDESKIDVKSADAHLSERTKTSKFSSGSPKQDQAFQTPEKRKSKKFFKAEPSAKRAKPDGEEYVPTYIHKNVSYLRKGQGDISTVTKKSFDLVEKHFIIPEDFEQSSKYGPLSGSCFEQRVISAYTLNLLEPRSKSSLSVAICSVCAVEGHRRNDCPTLI